MRQTADRDPLSSSDPASPVARSGQSQQELLQQLALRGAWRSILEAIKGQQIADQEQLLCQAAYYTLALIKLRNYTAATAELLKLGDLDAAHLTKTADDGRSVSMVPFSLRWLQADTQEQPDKMYQLLDYCTQQLEGNTLLAGTLKSLRATQRLHSISLQDDDFAAAVSDQADSPLSSQEKHAQMWARRQHMVVCNLVNRHVRSKEYKVALRWLSWLLTERRDDPGLWSVVGYVQLMLGDIAVADRTFHKAAELLSAAQTPEQKQRNQAIVRRHQGLLLFARNDFAGALAEFEASATVLSQAAAALQSRALVYVYSCNMGAAIQVTEDSMQSDLINYVSEPLLANLCTMYELLDVSGNDGADGKTRLLTLIGGILPDDFDAGFMHSK
ncbi:hypothetical protein ABBQ32_008408 [Trebouxia sp. C0010 RCD-2024]